MRMNNRFFLNFDVVVVGDELLNLNLSGKSPSRSVSMIDVNIRQPIL